MTHDALLQWASKPWWVDWSASFENGLSHCDRDGARLKGFWRTDGPALGHLEFAECAIDPKYVQQLIATKSVLERGVDPNSADGKVAWFRGFNDTEQTLDVTYSFDPLTASATCPPGYALFGLWRSVDAPRERGQLHYIESLRCRAPVTDTSPLHHQPLNSPGWRAFSAQSCPDTRVITGLHKTGQTLPELRYHCSA